jgi:hypothetical protein
MLANQMRAAKQPQVFRNGWAGDGKRAGNCSGGLAPAPQQIEDGTASRIGKRLKGGLRRICNRSVPHNA